jgi:hypothetical protein
MVSDVSKLGVGSAKTIPDRARAAESAGNPKAVAAAQGKDGGAKDSC